MKIRWTAKALRDIEALHEYISADNPEAATETVNHIVKAIDALETNPGLPLARSRRGTCGNHSLHPAMG